MRGLPSQNATPLDKSSTHEARDKRTCRRENLHQVFLHLEEGWIVANLFHSLISSLSLSEAEVGGQFGGLGIGEAGQFATLSWGNGNGGEKETDLPIISKPADFGNPLGVRTRDPFIKSEVLYQLS